MAVDWGSLRRLADRQSGLLTRRQCLTHGLSEDALRWRVTSRRWSRLHPGVYLTTPGRDDWLVHADAALLAASSGRSPADAGLRMGAAAHLVGLQSRPPTIIEVVVPEHRSVVVPGVRVKRSVRWTGLLDETAYPWRTTPVVTVLDLVAKGSELDALSMVARAVQRQLVSTSQVLSEITLRGGHRHSRLLRSALGEVAEGAESGIEVAYVRDVERAHGLPRSAAQVATGTGGRHDRGYDAYDLLVEVDGRLGHEEWHERVKDGRRDRVAQAGSRQVTRVFFSDVVLTPCRTAVEVAAVLAARGWTGRPRPCRRRTCAI